MTNAEEEKKNQFGVKNEMKKNVSFILLFFVIAIVFSQTREEFGIYDFFAPLDFDYKSSEIEYYAEKDSRIYDDKCHIKKEIQKAGAKIVGTKINGKYEYLFVGEKGNWISTDNCILKGSDSFPKECLFLNSLLANNTYWIPEWYTEFEGKKYIDIVRFIEKKIPRLDGFYPDWNGDDVSYWTSDFSCSRPYSFSFRNQIIQLTYFCGCNFLILNSKKNGNMYKVKCKSKNAFSREQLVADFYDLRNFSSPDKDNVYELMIQFEKERITLFNERGEKIVELVPVSIDWINHFTEFLKDWDEEKIFSWKK